MWSLLLLFTVTQFLPTSSSSAGSSLIFSEGPQGYARLGEVPVDGSLYVFFKLKTRARDGLLLYMREISAGHYVALSLSDGVLRLKLHRDTLITAVTLDTGENIKINDDQWHSVYLTTSVDRRKKLVYWEIDDFANFQTVQSLPLFDKANYDTFIGGLSSSDESEVSYVGCIKDIEVESLIDLQNTELTGATVGQCHLVQDSPPVFTGQLTGVVTDTDQVGSVIMNIRADREVFYELVENPKDYFALDSSSGNLSIAKQLDREALAEASNVLILTVSATDLNKNRSQDTTLRSIAQVSIIIMNETYTKVGLDEEGCLCGQRKYFVKKTIVGGEFAEVNEFPWAALLTLKSTETGDVSRCGGSLISDRHVITAAHCLKKDSLSGDNEFRYDDITITLGEHDASDDNETETLVIKTDYRKKQIHDLYYIRRGQGTIKNDIAILFLDEPVDFNKFPHIRPVCLPDGEDLSQDLTGRTGTAVGWGLDIAYYTNTSCGYTEGKGDPNALPSKLKKIDMKFVKHQDCNETFDDLFTHYCPAPKIFPVNLCASSQVGDICQGDSGGGLVALDSYHRNHVLYGIASFNLGCNSKTSYGLELPSIFTDVRFGDILEWMKYHGQSGKFCKKKLNVHDPELEVRHFPDESQTEATVLEDARVGQLVAIITVTDLDLEAVF